MMMMMMMMMTTTGWISNASNELDLCRAVPDYAMPASWFSDESGRVAHTFDTMQA